MIVVTKWRSYRRAFAAMCILENKCKLTPKVVASLAFYRLSSTRLINSIKHGPLYLDIYFE